MKGGLKWVALTAVILGLYSIAKDRLLFVDWDRSRDSSLGTAFPIGGGLWATARHVIDQCDRLGVADPAPGGGWSVAAAQTAFVDPNADVAILSARLDAAPHRIAPAAPVRGERGVILGFPDGRPAIVAAEMREVRRAHGEGTFALADRATVWRVDRIAPAGLPGFDGISGGPVFGADGAVVGVIIGSTAGGGRVIATSWRALTDAAAAAGAPPTGTTPSFPAFSPDLAMRLTRPVVCDVDGR